MIDFADNIYLWRIFRGLSQEGLAKKSGIPRPNISAIESGRREPSLSTVRRLAFILGTNPGILINGAAPSYLKGKRHLSREYLEHIIDAVLNKTKVGLSHSDKALSVMFSNIIKNRLNAQNGIYKNTIKRGSKDYISSWLILKAVIGKEVVNNLLSRLDKHIMMRPQNYGQNPD